MILVVLHVVRDMCAAARGCAVPRRLSPRLLPRLVSRYHWRGLPLCFARFDIDALVALVKSCMQ